MMKLFTASSIRQIEQDHIRLCGEESLVLMDRAASQFVTWILPKIKRNETIAVLCGKHNNGADGLVIGEKLASRGFSIRIYVINLSSKSSSEFDFHLTRIEPLFGRSIRWIESVENMDDIWEDVLIDAIIGNGIQESLRGPLARLVEHLNQQNRKVFAVDVPTGLHCDRLQDGIKMKADATMSFEFPKLSFFYEENAQHIGQWDYRSIQLNQGLISSQDTSFYMTTASVIRKNLSPRAKHSHKGRYGHVLLIAGSKGMTGAAVLSAKAAMETGAGLCTCLIGDELIPIVQTSIPEVMCKILQEDSLTDIENASNYTLAIGPGIGQSSFSKSIVEKALKLNNNPMVIDADALNVIATEKLLHLIPKDSILTPHPKEFERLFGPSENTEQRLSIQRTKSREYGVTIICKGHYSAITTPDGNVFFNSTGNPGMATAGSGDVLTGIAVGLLAQGMNPSDAAITAAFVHGMSGDMYAALNDHKSLTANDLVANLKSVFSSLK